MANARTEAVKVDYVSNDDVLVEWRVFVAGIPKAGTRSSAQLHEQINNLIAEYVGLTAYGH